MLTLLSKTSRWTLSEEAKERYFNTSLDAITGLLVSNHHAPCLKKDPTGKESLSRAKDARKRLKTIRKLGEDYQEELQDALRWVRIERHGGGGG